MARLSANPPSEIPEKVFFRIGEVARLLGVKPHVVRYWETEFPSVAPGKSSANQRVYRRAQVETLLRIRHLLYEERYSIPGARRRLQSQRASPPTIAAGQAERLKTLCRQLEELASEPLSRLFRF